MTVRSSLTTSPSQQMSIPEILCQISTFLAAGNDTTASALCWALYALSVSPRCQSRLRTDLHTICPTSSADELFADIQSLPYLDWVVRESLRLHAPATSTMRVCMKDRDVIPTAETWVGRDGVERSGIEVKKGDIITVPIQAVNKSKRIWGEDAGVFRCVVSICPILWVVLPSGVLKTRTMGTSSTGIELHPGVVFEYPYVPQRESTEWEPSLHWVQVRTC
jgi:cytochrome P450